MKQVLLRAMFLASILVFAASCNDDDDDDNDSNPTPSAVFTGTRIDILAGGTESEWTADAVTAEVGLFGDLTIKATEGSDTLALKVPSFEVRPYAISFDEEFGTENYFVSVSGNTADLYSYESGFDSNGDLEANGGGLLTITNIDTVAQRFDGEISSLIFYNTTDTTGNDRFILQNATLTNIAYTQETIVIGGPGTGDDELSLNVSGSALTLSTLTTTAIAGSVTLTGSSAGGFPSFTLSLPTNLSTGTYSIAGGAQITGLYVASATNNFVMNAGDLVVTSNANNRIEGTFSGDATGANGSVSITNGIFSAGY